MERYLILENQRLDYKNKVIKVIDALIHERSQTTCHNSMDFYKWNLTGDFRNPRKKITHNEVAYDLFFFIFG